MIFLSSFSAANPRLAVVRIVLGIGLLVLLLALARVQLVQADYYGGRAEGQSLRRIRIPAVRGEIVDRNGAVLAENRPSYDIVFYLDQLALRSKQRDLGGEIARNLAALGATLGMPVPLTTRDVRLHYQRRRPLPLTIWRDVSPATVAAFSERVTELPGADLAVTPLRHYPHGALAAHVLGYVGRAEDNEAAELEQFYYYEADSAGKQGVEKACDEVLRGEPGGRTIQVNPGGLKVAELGLKPATRGDRVVLTLDSRIQRLAEKALAEAPLPAGKVLRGAVVALDPRNGEVLALASAPTFDPNVFNPGAPDAAKHAVLTDPRQPMLNRAYGGSYAPGSTFKPVTLLAGLQAGTAALTDRAVCQGSLQIGNRAFGCWNHTGHGSVDALLAMKQSCDVWFYQRGMATGVDAISKTASEFGLGKPTGFDIGQERTGLVPTPDWKRGRFDEGWWNGDTAQYSIGQSYLLATPLQMAVLAAALANGGTVWRPFVIARVESPDGGTVRQTPPQARSRLSATPAQVAAVRRTLAAAVQDADGTAHRADVAGLAVAGKTGTAEYDVYEDGVRRRLKRAWFIGYAPAEQPTVAVAVLLEDADSGGHAAAPVAGAVFAGMFGKKVTGTGGGGD